MKGRKPQTVQAQIAKGDPAKRGKGKLQERLAAQPIAARGLPECPAHLEGRARVAWDAWREDLEAMSLDAKPDAQMLEGACVAYARAVDADILINQQGPVLEVGIFNKQGDEVGSRPIVNPYLTVSNVAWRNVKSFCSEFGLSPVSRTRLSVTDKTKPQSNLMERLAQPREPRAIQ